MDYNFSFSYDLPPSKPPANASPDLLILDECTDHPLPDGNVLLRSVRSGKKTIITPDVMYSLRFCDAFRTLAAHADHIAAMIPELSGQQEEIRQILLGVQRAGLLVSADKFSKVLTESTQDSRPDNSHAIKCILTCDRPEALQRVVHTILAHERRGDKAHWYVIDDSRKIPNQQANQHLIEQVNQQQEASFVYFGPTQQESYQSQLAKAIPLHAEKIGFLIGRYEDAQLASYGRSRNLALLLSVGKPLVFLDDDILYEKHAPPESNDSLRLSSHPREAVFYTDDSEWKHRADENSSGPAQDYLQFIGVSLADAIKLLDSPLDKNSIRDLYATELKNISADSKILATTCGAYGDPGTSSNTWIFALNKKSRDKLWQSAASYEQKITQRHMWSGRESYHFVTTFSLLSQCTGLDNKTLLPPYFPLFRNEDFLFGEALQFIHPQALLLEFPWALPHLPIESRDWNKKELSQPARYGFNGFAADYLARNKMSQHAASSELRLTALGHLFKDLAATDNNQLLHIVDEQTLRLQTGKAQYFSHVLEQAPEGPEYWKKDIQSLISSNQNSLSEPFVFKFAELNDSDSYEEAKSYWGWFGDCILAWPEIRDAAKEVNSRNNNDLPSET